MLRKSKLTLELTVVRSSLVEVRVVSAVVLDRRAALVQFSLTSRHRCQHHEVVIFLCDVIQTIRWCAHDVSRRYKLIVDFWRIKRVLCWYVIGKHFCQWRA